MGFSIDERDIMFCLFEHLDVESLTKLKPFAEHDGDLYKMVVSEAVKFATEKIAPTNLPADEEGVKFEDGVVKMPEMFHGLYKQYCEAGWNAVSMPVKWGGQGLPGLLHAAAHEGMVGANSSFSFTSGLTSAVIKLLDAYGTEEMQNLYLEKLTSGQWAGTMCLTEPNVGTALGDTATKGYKNEDGTYSIVGTKMFITSGDHDLTENIIHLVLGRADGSPKGIKGLSLFLIPKIRVDENGNLGEPNDVVCAKVEEKMGIHASATCMLNFGDNKNCKGWIIGQEGDGIRLMFNMMNEARIGVGLQGNSMTGAVYRMALDYAKERIQGTHILAMKDPNAPRVAIIEHPDVRRMLMTMKAFSEGCRALILFTAKMHDLADYSEDEDEKKKAHYMLEFLTPIVKAYPTDRSAETASEAIQAMGGVGYCREYGVEQYYRDAKISAIYEGANGVQALDLVGRKLGLKGGALFMTFMSELASFIDGGSDFEDLADLFKDLAAARDKIASIAMQFMGAAGSDPIFPVLSATPFLKAAGHVVCARLLLEQAVIAAGKLQKLMDEKGASDAAAFAKDSVDGAYYFNKKLTARFFIKNIVPEVNSIAERIATGDKSCLEAIL